MTTHIIALLVGFVAGALVFRVNSAAGEAIIAGAKRAYDFVRSLFNRGA